MASTDEMNANFGRFSYGNFFFQPVPYIIYYYHSIAGFQCHAIQNRSK